MQSSEANALSKMTCKTARKQKLWLPAFARCINTIVIESGFTKVPNVSIEMPQMHGEGIRCHEPEASCANGVANTTWPVYFTSPFLPLRCHRPRCLYFGRFAGLVWFHSHLHLSTQMKCPRECVWWINTIKLIIKLPSDWHGVVGGGWCTGLATTQW